MSLVTNRLQELGLTLPDPPQPVRANCLPFKRAGDLVFISGQGPRDAAGAWCTGKVGKDVSLQSAIQHARSIGLALISLAKEATGSFDGFEFVRVNGMVNCAPEFEDHPLVINGCSDVIVDVMGARGSHARTAVGMSSLPSGITVEIECIISLS